MISISEKTERGSINVTQIRDEIFVINAYVFENPKDEGGLLMQMPFTRKTLIQLSNILNKIINKIVLEDAVIETLRIKKSGKKR